MYQNLLVAVDLNQDTRLLLKKTGQLARKLNANIHVIYVEPGVSVYSLEDIEMGLTEVHQQTLKMRQEQLEQLCVQLMPQPVSIVVAHGDVAGQLVEFKEVVHADLVIMGEHHSFWHLQHTDRQVRKELIGDLLTVSLE